MEEEKRRRKEEEERREREREEKREREERRKMDEMRRKEEEDRRERQRVEKIRKDEEERKNEEEKRRKEKERDEKKKEKERQEVGDLPLLDMYSISLQKVTRTREKSESSRSFLLWNPSFLLRPLSLFSSEMGDGRETASPFHSCIIISQSIITFSFSLIHFLSISPSRV